MLRCLFCRLYSRLLSKRRLAQQASEPGASVSHLAQQHGINASMLFKWRRLLVAGLFEVPQSTQVMLPVAIVAASASVAPQGEAKSQAFAVTVPAADTGVARQGVIEIQIADATIRFDGHADLATLHAVVKMVRTVNFRRYGAILFSA
ncbi:MAG: IS66-like element accessory protein TnpA [Noviherbaspirillum sp.]